MQQAPQFGFIIDWREIGQGRVQSLLIVDRLDKPADRRTGMGEVLILAGIDLLALDRLHEALGHGIVIAPSLSNWRQQIDALVVEGACSRANAYFLWS